MYTFTPTPEFQALLNTHTKEAIALKFLDHLKETHPIPADIKLTVKFSNRKKTHKGSIINAVITQNKLTRTADIEIFDIKNTAVPALINSVAHEYKHIIQKFVDGTMTSTISKPVIKEEVEAGIFGVFQSRKFCYGW